MSADGERVVSLADLFRVPANEPVLRRIEGSSAHGDLAEVVVRNTSEAPELTVVAAGEGGYPAIVVARRDALIVAFATGMRSLGVRVGSPPDGARLEPEPLTDLGRNWWSVNPFAADVSIPDTAEELSAWFSRLA